MASQAGTPAYPFAAGRLPTSIKTSSEVEPPTGVSEPTTPSAMSRLLSPLHALYETFQMKRKALDLPSPGIYENLHGEVRNVFPSVMMFDGAKFEIGSVMSQSPAFQVSHQLRWGSSSYPNTYTFNSIFANDKYLLRGQVDSDGVLQAIGHHFWVRSPMVATSDSESHQPAQPKIQSTSKATAQIVPADSQGNSMLNLEHDYVGSDFSASVKLINPNPIDAAPQYGGGMGRKLSGQDPQPLWGSSFTGVFVLQYLQSVSKNLALGGEFVLQRVQPEIEDSVFTLVAKYCGKPSVVRQPPPPQPGMPPLMPLDPSYTWTTTFQPASGVLHTSYHHKLNQRLELAAELQALFGGGRREGIATVGFKAETMFAQIKGSIDTQGKVQAILEERLAPPLAFTNNVNPQHFHQPTKEWPYRTKIPSTTMDAKFLSLLPVEQRLGIVNQIFQTVELRDHYSALLATLLEILPSLSSTQRLHQLQRLVDLVLVPTFLDDAKTQRIVFNWIAQLSVASPDQMGVPLLMRLMAILTGDSHEPHVSHCAPLNIVDMGNLCGPPQPCLELLKEIYGHLLQLLELGQGDIAEPTIRALEPQLAQTMRCFGMDLAEPMHTRFAKLQRKPKTTIGENAGPDPAPIVLFYKEKSFWKMIQTGLSSPSTTVYKAAQSVFKRTISFCSLFEGSDAAAGDWTEYFKWSGPEMWRQWMLTFEVISESSSIRLIEVSTCYACNKAHKSTRFFPKPVLSGVQEIAIKGSPNASPRMHPSWWMIIVRRGFASTSWGVRRKFIDAVLALPSEALTGLEDCHDFAYGDLISALDQTRFFYSKDLGSFESDFGKQISLFFPRLVSALQPSTGAYVERRIMGVVNSVTVPACALFILHALSNCPYVGKWEFTELNALNSILVSRTWE
ncbi:translocase of outer mitochondrial membrane [Gonapodya sp. JEL0774]|nr:translocase of outer mitochondrial membrane [Gonapodya sp. JEL0774]